MGNFIKGFFRVILELIFVIIYAVTLVFASGVGLEFVHNKLYGADNYIFYTIPIISFFSLFGLLCFWSMYIILKIKNKRFEAELEKEIIACNGAEILSEEEINKDKFLKFLINISDIYCKLEKKFIFIKSRVFKRTLIASSISISLVLLVISFTNYSAINEDSIIVKTTFSEDTYSYKDIKEINVGIMDNKDINLYYKLVLKDGTIFDMMNGSFIAGDESKPYEIVLIDLDKKLLARGIKKVRDLENLDKFYKQNYDNTYTKNVIDLIHQ